MRKPLAILCLLCTLQTYVFATFGAATVWDVRTAANGGADTNGGGFDSGVGSPGTNQSTGSGTAVTVTLVTGTTGTGSPAFSSTTNGPGNFIHIASGSGCTTGWFEILSQTGGTATFDHSMGSSTDTCTGVLGGSLLTPVQAGVEAVNGNGIYIQNGAYSSSAAFALVACPSLVAGYNSTQGDLAGASQPIIEADRPVLTQTANSTNWLTLTANCGGQVPTTIQFLAGATTASTKYYGICPTVANNKVVVDGVKLSNFTEAVAGDDLVVCYPYLSLVVTRSEISGCTLAAIWQEANSLTATNNWIHDCTLGGGATGLIVDQGSNANVSVFHNIISGISVPSGAAVLFVNGGNNVALDFESNTLYNITGSAGVIIETSAASMSTNVVNNVFYSYAGAVFNSIGRIYANCNAYGSGGTTGTGNPLSNNNVIPLTANPFVASGSNNYAPNSTAGGGALLRAAACPGVFPGQSTTSDGDVGAVQSQASASGGGAPYGYVQ